MSAINLQPGVALTLAGQGNAIDGGGRYAGLFVYAGSVTLDSLAIDGTVARGGAGGLQGAGGGAGLGGGLFIAGSNPGLASGGNVTLVDVTFDGDTAAGGAGDGGGGTFEGHYGPYGTGGGGGGLGGPGGDYGVYSGGGGGIGAAAGPGKPGIVVGASGGGSGAPQEGPPNSPINAGGANGGGGGNGTAGSFDPGGGGGIGGSSGMGTGAGGFGGGGGGGGGHKGGDGGFGGGGGSGIGGGAGGFGGGGGTRSGVASDGPGGFGAGTAVEVSSRGPPAIPAYEGGGGLGAGGAIFVQAGGRLTIGGGQVSGNSAVGGPGGSVPTFVTPANANGQGLGSGIFLQGDQTLAFDEAAGQSTVIRDVIADQSGSGGTGSNAGAGGISLFGAGRLTLVASNSFTGGTMLDGGTLELASAGSAGSGAITFSGPATLQIDATALSGGLLANQLVGFSNGDALDFRDLSSMTATYAGGVLSVSGQGVTDQVALSTRSGGLPSSAPPSFTTAPDGQGGTLVTLAPQTVTVGSGPDSIRLAVSEDAYKGDATFTLAVDGVQVGDTLTAVASHASGQDQTFDVRGNFGPGTHAVTVDYLNDDYGGSPAADRNLYVDAIGSAGGTVPADGALLHGGPATFLTPPQTPQAGGPTTITLGLSEDAYYGDAQATVSVDGQQAGGVVTVTAFHAAGQEQGLQLPGTYGAGPHIVTLNFLNDLYGGNPAADRNLYVDSITANGATVQSAGALLSAGPASFAIPTLPQTVLGSGPAQIALQIAEDAYQGNAQFSVSVDGQQVGGVQTATASHAAGQAQSFLLKGNFGAGPHTVSIDYLNDVYGGSPSADRNLYVDSITAGGVTAQPQAELYQSGTQDFDTPAPLVAQIGSGPDQIGVAVSEDAYQGDAQFTVSVDGQQEGGIQTATASHAAGQDQTFDVNGSFGPGPRIVTVDFQNDDYGGTPSADRNLYVDSITANGVTAQTGGVLDAAGSANFTSPSQPTVFTSDRPNEASGALDVFGGMASNIGTTNLEKGLAGIDANIVGSGMTFISGSDVFIAGGSVAAPQSLMPLDGAQLELGSADLFSGIVTAQGSMPSEIQLDGISAGSSAYQQTSSAGGVPMLSSSTGQLQAGPHFNGTYPIGDVAVQNQ